MTIYRRSRVTFAAACGLTALVLAMPISAAAAPYTADAVVEVSTTNPAVGGQLLLTVHGFTPGETVVFELQFTVYNLGSAVVDANGDASVIAQLPPGVACQHVITATSPSHFASTDIVIGPPQACTAGGNGNVGNGNVGNNNSGNGNVGNNNGGSGNTGNNNGGGGHGGYDYSGYGNTGPGYGDWSATGWGYVSYARATAPAPLNHAPEVALASIAVVGAAGFLRRRRNLS